MRVFVTVDPERDTTTWLHEFARYMPAGFAAVTGTAAEIAATAAGWGVTYAREDIAADGELRRCRTRPTSISSTEPGCSVLASRSAPGLTS